MTPQTLVLAAVLTGSIAATAAVYVHDRAYTGHATVVDGDTLRIGSQAVRLAGVDAEELSEPNGHAARAALIKLTHGLLIECRPVGKSYNRVVATCTVEGRDIGAELIRQGFALDCARYSHGKYRALEPAGARARLRQKGYCEARP